MGSASGRAESTRLKCCGPRGGGGEEEGGGGGLHLFIRVVMEYQLPRKSRKSLAKSGRHERQRIVIAGRRITVTVTPLEDDNLNFFDFNV